MDLQKYTKLRKLVVGNSSYKYLKVINLTKMEHLESVSIGKSSFFEVMYNDWKERQFYLVDCPKITELTIGEFSLAEYSHFVVKRCNSLLRITTDAYSIMASSMIIIEGNCVVCFFRK